MEESKLQQKCTCKCHFGGAVSCPGCIKNHEGVVHCDHCMKS